MVITSACGADYTGSIPVGHPKAGLYMTEKKKKIAIISVSTGSGHVRAAQAIFNVAQKFYPEIEAEHINMMDYVSATLKNSIVESYDIIAKQLPELWGFFYKKTDRPKISEYIPKFISIFHQGNTGKFFKYINQFNPDHILCTHFLPIYAIGVMQKKNNTTKSVSLLMTDYHTHFLQKSPIVSHYFVSTKKMSWKLTQKGVPAQNITISGIPIDPSFYQDKNNNELKKSYNADNGKKNILVLSGGQGLVKIDGIITTLFKTKQKINIFAVAGNNRKLKKSLEKLIPPENINLNVIGWTDKMDEYMRIADLIITKPGGLTTTECVALQKPIIAVSPIPGQEEYNAEYILENNLGVIAQSYDDLLYYVENENDFFAPKPANVLMEKQNISAEIILNKIKEIT